MSTTPGDRGGDCPACDGERVLVGYADAVLAAYCKACDLLQPIHSDVWADGPAGRLVGAENRTADVWRAKALEGRDDA